VVRTAPFRYAGDDDSGYAGDATTTFTSSSIDHDAKICHEAAVLNRNRIRPLDVEFRGQIEWQLTGSLVFHDHLVLRHVTLE
jgi:hypothetical protein